MRVIACILAMTAALLSAPAQDPVVSPVSPGIYVVSGTDKGTPYTSVALVLKKGDVYVVHYLLGSGSVYTGVGFQKGDSFAVGWAAAGPGGQAARGVNLYRLKGQRLTGRWVSGPGVAHAQEETMELVRELTEEGDFVTPPVPKKKDS